MPNLTPSTTQSPLHCEPTLLLLTHAPDHPSTQQGLSFARNFCQTWQITNPKQPIDLAIFCYSDAAHLGNRLVWLPADMSNVVKEWQQLTQDFGLTIQICVSTALARGVVDVENAKRHGLVGDNLAIGFELVGLGELAMHLHHYTHVKQF